MLHIALARWCCCAVLDVPPSGCRCVAHCFCPWALLLPLGAASPLLLPPSALTHVMTPEMPLCEVWASALSALSSRPALSSRAAPTGWRSRGPGGRPMAPPWPPGFLRRTWALPGGRSAGAGHLACPVLNWVWQPSTYGLFFRVRFGTGSARLALVVAASAAACLVLA